MTGELRVLIVGGYGTFGGRLARLLAQEPRVVSLVAGRSLEKAERFCRTYLEGARAEPCVFDRNDDLATQLTELHPDIVVDASGPFQDYGRDVYRLVSAVIDYGADYFDIADGTGFVTGIGAFDGVAREKGCVVLSGASSYPALSAAVARHLASRLARVEGITAGIAPSPFAPLGESVVRAGIGYGGQPVVVIRGGENVTGHALCETRRATIAPPGTLPLRNRLFSLVDVPDFKILSGMFPDLDWLWLGFGPAPDAAQRGLNLLAWLVKVRLLPSLKPFAPLIVRVAGLLRWGEAAGGMFVVVRGYLGDGSRAEFSWHLVAWGDDGPFIPAMAVAAMVRRCVAGDRPGPGARPASDDVELADYEALFDRFAISSGVREASARVSALPLYRRLLGSAWDALPGPVRALHDLDGVMEAKGRAEVTRGGGLLSRLAGALFRFPKSGTEVPVSVGFQAQDGRETWRRDFAGRKLESEQWQGRGRSAYLLNERFGPVTFALALAADKDLVTDMDRLRLVLRRWSFLGVPMPMAWAPRGDAYEFAEAGRFRFHVEISHPWTGLIVRYRGWLEPQPVAETARIPLRPPRAPGTLA